VTASTNDPLAVSAPDLDPTALRESLDAIWGLDGELTAVHGERDSNFRVDTGRGRYLLKVHNPADGDEVLDLQYSALRHLRAVAPDLPVPEVVPTRHGERSAVLTGLDGRSSPAWVMTWLEGRHPTSEELGAEQLRGWGRTSARLGQALRGFVHPAAAYPIAWDIRRLPQLRPWLEAVDESRRRLVRGVLDRFEQQVSPELLRVRAQVVHNDLAPTNVLVDDTLEVTGITDFGDMTHTALVCDLAVVTADFLSGRDDFLEVGHEVLAGYAATTPLEPREVSLLADLVAGRYAAAIVITAWRTRELGSAPQIDHAAYRQLEAMVDAGLDSISHRWSATVAGGTSTTHDVSGLPYRRRPTSELLEARAQVLGGQELSYADPVHLVGGRGVHLESADGRRYLDAYNNVPVLGHSHPAVVDAVGTQLATLNTNSRYLQDAPVALAERLLATLPERFDRVLLVNSGSEANDLAWRIARHETGASGGIATSWAYHGVTEATFAFSPESWSGRPAPAHIRLVDPPGAAESSDVASAVESLRSSAHGLAAMLVDGVFTSDGIRGPAHDWTLAAAAAVHAAGGLYVADEVQAGHGRTGDHLWSFVAGDVPADLVTLGKPMGNGYPVAAVCGPAELVDPFIAETDYFSTFGGGTAACAAALAVLRVLEEEHVVAGVAAVGARLLSALRSLTADHPQVGEVRGWGLALGVDIVATGTGLPDPALATAVVDGMRERGVLIGRTGPVGATLKIRPPLVFTDDDAEVLLTALAETLRG
jgi:4-aminobutyrate aminotransferase-like enzyme/Ser/Thr protein kinase RdoA (MazF antagonist)